MVSASSGHRLFRSIGFSKDTNCPLFQTLALQQFYPVFKEIIGPYMDSSSFASTLYTDDWVRLHTYIRPLQSVLNNQYGP